MTHTLKGRREEVLRIVVDEYVSTATPVSSEIVARKHLLRPSSATVRNEMAELENDGYIRRPHVSAGGTPSDKGYRYYVEYLAGPEELPEAEKLQVLELLRSSERDLDAWLELSAHLLARLARNVAIVTVPRYPQPRLQHLDLVSLQDLLGLLVLVLQQTRIRKELVALKEPATREELLQSGNKLSALYAGLTWREIRSRAWELSPLELQVLEQAMEMMRQEELALEEGYVEGFQHLLSQPEFSHAQQRVPKLASLLESKHLRELVAAQSPEGAEPRVVIGAENDAEDLKEFSLVLGRYGVPGEATGTLAVVGPTRLAYERAMASVRYLSQLLGELVEGVRGRAPLV